MNIENDWKWNKNGNRNTKIQLKLLFDNNKWPTVCRKRILANRTERITILINVAPKCLHEYCYRNRWKYFCVQLVCKKRAQRQQWYAALKGWRKQSAILYWCKSDFVDGWFEPSTKRSSSSWYRDNHSHYRLRACSHSTTQSPGSTHWMQIKRKRRKASERESEACLLIALRNMICQRKTTTTRWHFLYYYNFLILIILRVHKCKSQTLNRLNS